MDLTCNGRLTTSRAAGATGMLENKFAAKLGIPRSLSGNGKARQSYFHLLGQTAFTSLQEAEESLIVEDVDQGEHLKVNPSRERENCIVAD